MKKLMALLAALVVATLGLAGPASATQGGGDLPTPDDGKDVTICHYDGSNNNGGSGKYSKITIDINGWYGSGNGNSGHRSHTNDIWAAFDYIHRTGPDEGDYEVVHVPAQGDTSRLAFDNCKTPDDNEKVAKPEPTFNDPCGTKNDMFAVAPGRGYTVGPVQHAGGNQSITVTLAEDFVWADGTSTPLTFTKPEFTSVDCGLPETGGKETAAGVGLGALALLAGAGVMLARTRKTKA